MNPMILGISALALYLTGTVLILLRLRQRAPIDRPWVLVSMGLAVVLHAMVLGMEGWQGGLVNLGFYNALSIVGLAVAVLVFAGALVRPVENLGIVLLPAAALTMALQLKFGAGNTLWRNFDWQLNIHIALTLFAFAILSLAAAQAVILWSQDRALRLHPAGSTLLPLPSLQRMETVLFQLIGLGFGLLTLGLLAGAFYISDLAEQRLIHKTVLSVVAWAVFGMLLWGRWRFGWRGRTAIRMTLAGVAVLLLAYFGSKLVLELILQRVE
ncbi:MAG: cytochrome c biogenesis protein CcsA [Xanthomonadales bacterium]|nr:cytochrome c biogenesis protein CcsA [Xanthomonadales bacterium]